MVTCSYYLGQGRNFYEDAVKDSTYQHPAIIFSNFFATAGTFRPRKFTQETGLIHNISMYNVVTRQRVLNWPSMALHA